MTRIDADVAVIGAGFGGSLLALLLQRIGLSCVLIERDQHPRFAIGESSTPQADLVLESLAGRYGLPWLASFARYGTWRRTYPTISRGCKRGFSYFHHVAGRPFSPRADHAGELLVAASTSDEVADTHWYRPDFDAYLVDRVREAGIPYVDRTRVTRLVPGDRWRLDAVRSRESTTIGAAFVVDATGGTGMLVQALGLDDDAMRMHTNSRTVYSHFRGVRPWSEVLEELGAPVTDHPFPAHVAALHHVFDGGWMYVLHFDNGITSAGFVIDRGRLPSSEPRAPEAEWNDLLDRFPSIARQFRDASAVRPLVRTDRLQRRVDRAAGANWALLPHTAGFVDPLHSSGNAHTLWGIERLVRAMGASADDRTATLAAYDDALRRESELIDLLVHGCYAGFTRFDLMVGAAMPYFAGAHYSEHRRRTGAAEPDDLFLNAHDRRFVDVVRRLHDEVVRLGAHRASDDACAAFTTAVARAIEPWNLAGLGDPRRRNMYACV